MASNDPKNSPSSTPSNPPMAEAADIFALNEEGGEAFVDFGTVAPIHEGASGVIPIDELPDPPSGQSLTSWTEVIRRQRAAAEVESLETPIPEASPVRVDSPSDRDLLSHLLNTEAQRPSSGHSSSVPMNLAFPPGPADTTEIPQAELPVIAEASEASDPHLNVDDLEAILPGVMPSSASGGSAVRFEVMDPPSDAGGILPYPSAGPSSDVRISSAKPYDDLESIPFEASAGPGSSSAALGELPAGGPEGTRSSILDVLLSESNLEIPIDEAPSGFPRNKEPDIGNTPFRSSKPTVPTSGDFGRTGAPTQPSFGLPDDSQEVNMLPAGLEEGTSESRYGMEILEPTKFDDSDDAVDLYGEDVPQPSLTDSGSLEISDEVIEEAARKQRLVESSSVDLSSRPSLHGSEFDMDVEPSDELRESDNDAIDLDLPETRDIGNSSMIRPNDMDDSTVLREELEARRKPKSSKITPLTPAREEARGSDKKWGVIGTAAGLLLGAGGVFGAWAAGILPNQQVTQQVAGTDPAELNKIRGEADSARKNLEDYKALVTKSFSDAKIATPEEGLAALPTIISDRDKATAKLNELLKEAQTLQMKADAAEKQLVTAKSDLKTAQDALTANETKLADAKKAADDATTALVAVTKSFKDAGLDPAKPTESLKELLTKKVDAEKLAKDYEAKVETAMKGLTDAIAAADAAKKLAQDTKVLADSASKAKEAAEGSLKTLTEKLVKAKFVPANADSAALLKGVDDAIKAGSSDATMALREELVKVRDAATKAKTEMDALAAKQQSAEKLAIAAEAQAKKAADDLKALTAKATADIEALTANGLKLSKEVTELTVKTNAANAKAAQASKQLDAALTELAVTKDQMGSQITKLKTENESLTKDLSAVRELSLAIKTQASASNGPIPKVDPADLADRFYSDALRFYYQGRYSEAEGRIVKTVSIYSDDARYHYLLGLTLLNQGKTEEAKTAFTKGAELESIGRPVAKSVDAMLERIQGRARQIVNSYRP